jgi:hypothetical protein
MLASRARYFKSTHRHEARSVTAKTNQCYELTLSGCSASSRPRQGQFGSGWGNPDNPRESLHVDERSQSKPHGSGAAQAGMPSGDTARAAPNQKLDLLGAQSRRVGWSRLSLSHSPQNRNEADDMPEEGLRKHAKVVRHVFAPCCRKLGDVCLHST